MEKTLKISNKQQIDRLFDLVEKHPDIGTGKGQYGSSRQQIKNTWEQFAIELNSLGLPTRTGQEWQRVWIHYKANLKRKLAKNKENFLATGGGPSQEVSLTATEERVYELTQVNLSINPAGCAFGLGAGDVTVATEPPVVEAATPAPKPRIVKAGKAKMQLIEDQARTQAAILNTLKKMEDNQYKIYKLKRDKMKMLEKQEKQASVLRELNIEIAKEKLKRLQKKLCEYVNIFCVIG